MTLGMEIYSTGHCGVIISTICYHMNKIGINLLLSELLFVITSMYYPEESTVFICLHY